MIAGLVAALCYTLFALIGGMAGLAIIYGFKRL